MLLLLAGSALAFTPIITSDRIDSAALTRAVGLRCADEAETATLTVTEPGDGQLSFVLFDDNAASFHTWQLPVDAAATIDLDRSTAVAICDRLTGRTGTPQPQPEVAPLSPVEPAPEAPPPFEMRWTLPPQLEQTMRWPDTAARIDDRNLRLYVGVGIGQTDNDWDYEAANSRSGRVVDAVHAGGRLVALPVLELELRYTATTEQYDYRWWTYDHETQLVAAFNPLRQTRAHRALRVRLGLAADALSIQTDLDLTGPQPFVGSIGPVLGAEYGLTAGRLYARGAVDAARIQGPVVFGARSRFSGLGGVVVSRTLAFEGELTGWIRWTSGTVADTYWEHQQSGWVVAGRLAFWLAPRSDRRDVPQLDVGAGP